jgi:hypothetical protein
MDKQLKTDMMAILDYMWEDEKKHWREGNWSEQHIFVTMRRVKKKLNEMD